MKNGVFEIAFHSECGGISGLVLASDAQKMNFCRDGRAMSVLRGFALASFEQTEHFARAVSPQRSADITEACGLRKGAFADAFANDQDFALYFFMKMRADLK